MQSASFMPLNYSIAKPSAFQTNCREGPIVCSQSITNQYMVLLTMTSMGFEHMRHIMRVWDSELASLSSRTQVCWSLIWVSQQCQVAMKISKCLLTISILYLGCCRLVIDLLSSKQQHQKLIKINFQSPNGKFRECSYQSNSTALCFLHQNPLGMVERVWILMSNLIPAQLSTSCVSGGQVISLSLCFLICKTWSCRSTAQNETEG